MLLVNRNNLHPILYFVADKPGKKNLDPAIPLVGTQSYVTLLNWLGRMDVDVTRVRFYNQIDNPFPGHMVNNLNLAITKGQIKIIALGDAAMNYLMNADIVEYYCLPHPSPANKANHKDIKKDLDSCRTFIYNGTNE